MCLPILPAGYSAPMYLDIFELHGAIEVTLSSQMLWPHMLMLGTCKLFQFNWNISYLIPRYWQDTSSLCRFWYNGIFFVHDAFFGGVLSGHGSGNLLPSSLGFSWVAILLILRNFN